MQSETGKQFGSRVRTLRTDAGISLRQFALMIGIDKSFLVDVEYGRKSPTLETIEKISKGLDIPISTIVEGVGAVANAQKRTSKKPIDSSYRYIEL